MPASALSNTLSRITIKIVLFAEQVPEFFKILAELFEDRRPKITQDLYLVAEILHSLAPFVESRLFPSFISSGHRLSPPSVALAKPWLKKLETRLSYRRTLFFLQALHAGCELFVRRIHF